MTQKSMVWGFRVITYPQPETQVISPAGETVWPGGSSRKPKIKGRRLSSGLTVPAAPLLTGLVG